MRHRLALVLRRLAHRIDPERRGSLMVPADDAAFLTNLMILYAADKARERRTLSFSPATYGPRR